MNELLRSRLLERGVSEPEIDAAEAEGRLALFAVDRLLLPGPARYDQAEVAARAGVEPAIARRLWRAMGFTDVDAGDRVFTDADVGALAAVAAVMEQGLADLEVTSRLSRVIGSSVARIADAQIGVMEERMAGLIQEGHLSDTEVAALVISAFEEMRPQWGRLLGYVYDRHLNAAVKRAGLWHAADGQSHHDVAVGFADLVGFTALSQELDEAQLAAVVDRFETLAYDIIAQHQGRIVKVIGDEVMFVSDDVVAAADIALALAEAYAEDETLSDVRVGLASGPVMAYEGDLFGPVVNLASRLVNIAYSGTVVVSEEVYTALEGHPGFGWKPIRPRRLKGIGWTPMWSLTRPGEGRQLASELARRVRSRRQLKAKARKPSQD